jgi:hypothetical protein
MSNFLRAVDVRPKYWILSIQVIFTLGLFICDSVTVVLLKLLTVHPYYLSFILLLLQHVHINNKKNLYLVLTRLNKLDSNTRQCDLTPYTAAFPNKIIVYWYTLFAKKVCVLGTSLFKSQTQIVFSLTLFITFCIA